MRNLIIRNTVYGEWMVIVVFHEDNLAHRNMLMEHLRRHFPFITSLQYVINPKRNDTIFDLEVTLFSGRDYIVEQMDDLYFRISAKSFYQTNSYQAYELYKIVKEFAALKGDEIVYDLYTGTGTIAAYLSRSARQIIGIDYIDDAIVDARKNANDNNLLNLRFFTGDIKATLNEEFVNKNGRPDVIITDPPRAGMHEDVVRTILKVMPEKMVYVSCNPSTQARDLQLLDEGYRMENIQPVDMFPHTSHVENVVLLNRR
jgi:23S rRNA (uracil1939-C5)-methyltransferase